MGGRECTIPKRRGYRVNYMLPTTFLQPEKSIDFGVQTISQLYILVFFGSFGLKWEAGVFSLFFSFLFAFLVQGCRLVPPKDVRKLSAHRRCYYGYEDINIGVKPGVSAAINSGPHLQPCSWGCCYTILFLVLKRILMIRNHEVTWKKVTC